MPSFVINMNKTQRDFPLIHILYTYKPRCGGSSNDITHQSRMINIPCFRNLEQDFEGFTLGSISLAAQLMLSLPSFLGGNLTASLGLGMLHQLPTNFVFILSNLFSFLNFASCPLLSQNSFLISVSKLSTLIFSTECPFLAVLSGLGQKYLWMEQISLLFSSTLNCWSARGLILLLMMPISFLFRPRYLILQVFRMIYQTRMARSFRERLVYLETSMSSCYSCLRMRSRVSSDLLRAERIQKCEMFLWKRVLVQDAFFILIEESNIIIPPLISLAAYPCNPEGNPL